MLTEQKIMTAAEDARLKLTYPGVASQVYTGGLCVCFVIYLLINMAEDLRDHLQGQALPHVLAAVAEPWLCVWLSSPLCSPPGLRPARFKGLVFDSTF